MVHTFTILLGMLHCNYLFSVGLSYCSELLAEKGQILFLPAHYVAGGLHGWNSVTSGTGVLGYCWNKNFWRPPREDEMW